MEKIDGRTRDARREKLKAERRSRTGNLGQPLNLAVTGDLDQAYVYRWVNDDEKARLARKRQQDWEPVRAKDGLGVENPKTAELGDAVSTIVGAKKDGSPMRSYLMRKPRELHEIDQEIRAERQAEMDNAIRRGRYSEDGKLAADSAFYNPDNRRNIIEQR